MKRFAGLMILLAACSARPLDAGEPFDACPVGIECAPSCSSFSDTTSCNSTSGCVAVTCLMCDGSEQFAACYDATDPPPPECGAPNCPAQDCSKLTDETSCNAAPGCFAFMCASCNGSESFVACYAKIESPPLQCPEMNCPACAQHGDDADCSADPNCYSLFETGMECPPTPGMGCPMLFSQCLVGPALCGSGPACPNVQAPTCAGTFSPALSNGCEIGCVHESLCITN